MSAPSQDVKSSSEGKGLYLLAAAATGLLLSAGVGVFASLLQNRLSASFAGPWPLVLSLPVYLAAGLILFQVLLMLLCSGPGSPLFFRPVVRLFPLVLSVCRLFRGDEMRLRRSFLALNNERILKLGLRLRASEILLLLPHCLQNDDCQVKITGITAHCKRCGRCPICSLLEISERTGVPMAVATGGTQARRILKEKGSKAVVAVACERDLTEGVLDTYPMPVLGIFNDRPFGPCFNTGVDLEAVEGAIRALSVPASEANDPRGGV